MNSKLFLFIFLKWILFVISESAVGNDTVKTPPENADVLTVKSTTTTTTLTPVLATTTQTNETSVEEGDWWAAVYEKRDMLHRALYVLAAVTTITILYFGIRFISARRRRVKRYGLLSAQRETIALNPLNSDSEDDYTVFEARPLT